MRDSELLQIRSNGDTDDRAMPDSKEHSQREHRGEVFN